MKRCRLLFFSLIFIFIVSCSGVNPHNSVFLDRVAGKYTGSRSSKNGAFFSDNGRACEVISEITTTQYYFKEAKSNSEAIYTPKLNSNIEVIFTVVDDNLSISTDGAKIERGKLKTQI